MSVAYPVEKIHHNSESRTNQRDDTPDLPIPTAEEIFGPEPSQPYSDVGADPSPAMQIADQKCARLLAEAVFEDPPEAGGKAKKSDHDKGIAPLAVSWADFDAEQFPQGERIAFAAERGEIALLNALPNAGKTTLALNVAVSLAAGRAFPPLVTERAVSKNLSD